MCFSCFNFTNETKSLNGNTFLTSALLGTDLGPDFWFYFKLDLALLGHDVGLDWSFRSWFGILLGIVRSRPGTSVPSWGLGLGLETWPVPSLPCFGTFTTLCCDFMSLTWDWSKHSSSVTVFHHASFSYMCESLGLSWADAAGFSLCL